MEGVSKRDFNKLMAKIAIIEQATNLAADVNDLISEKDAALLLDRSVLTIQTWVYKGKMNSKAYTVGEGGVRFYRKSYLLGLKTA